MKIGWIEGVEVNLFSFIAGLDLRQPALSCRASGGLILRAAE